MRKVILALKKTYELQSHVIDIAGDCMAVETSSDGVRIPNKPT